MSFPQVPIGELVSRVKTWNPRAQLDNRTIEYIDLSSIDREAKVIDVNADLAIKAADAPSRARQIVSSGDVLVSTVRPNLNGVAVIPEQLDGATASTGYCVLRPLCSKLSNRYLFHWVRTHYFIEDMVKKSTGANYPAVSDRIVKDSNIPLPPLKEQQHIAAILDKADAIRRKRQQAIALADEFLRSVFLEMFGDPTTNLKGWELSTISSLCNVNTGATPSRKEASYYGGNIPWVKTTEVDWGVIYDTAEKITEAGLKDSNCKINPAESIVIAMYGQGKTRGKVCRLGIEAATNQACAVLRPSSRVNMTYLYYHLKFSYENLRCLGQGGGQPNLNLSIVKEFPIMNPPKHLQITFSKVASRLGSINSSQNGFWNHSTNFFESLRQRAFSGEL